MAKQGMTRRNFMQQSAAMAAAFAAGSAGGLGQGLRAAREGAEHPLLGGLQLGAGARPVPRADRRATVKAESLTNDPTMINRLRAGETNVWDLINVNNPWARKIMFPEGLIKRARPRALRALLREDDAGVQAALQMGDGRQRREAARHGAALRALQLRRQHRQGQPRDRRGPGLGSVERRRQRRQIRRAGIGRLERLQPLLHRRLRSVPRAHRGGGREIHRDGEDACSRAPSWSATSPR